MGIRGPKPIDAEERFWPLVDMDRPYGCWLWTGARLLGPGYGAFRLTTPRRVTVSTHRYSWTLHNGPIPEGLFVLHRCSKHYPKGDITYRRCVNPAHLKLGTARENIEQAKAEGRMVAPPVWHGEANPMATLTWSLVQEVRMWAAAGVPYTTIGTAFGVSGATISDIVHYRTWREEP